MLLHWPPVLAHKSSQILCQHAHCLFIYATHAVMQIAKTHRLQVWSHLTFSCFLPEQCKLQIIHRLQVWSHLTVSCFLPEHGFAACLRGFHAYLRSSSCRNATDHQGTCHAVHQRTCHAVHQRVCITFNQRTRHTDATHNPFSLIWLASIARQGLQGETWAQSAAGRKLMLKEGM